MTRRRDGFFLNSLSNLGEVPRIAEILVDAGEANVGDMIERLEPGHNRFTNTHGRDLVTERFHLPLDAAHEAVDPCRIDVALAAGVADGAGELVAIKWLALR